MRRLARRLFTLCPAVSLVLCVAACALWARSYAVADVLHVRTSHRWGYLEAGGGRLRAGAWLTADHDPASDADVQRAVELASDDYAEAEHGPAGVPEAGQVQHPRPAGPAGDCRAERLVEPAELVPVEVPGQRELDPPTSRTLLTWNRSAMSHTPWVGGQESGGRSQGSVVRGRADGELPSIAPNPKLRPPTPAS